jgi:hypothetical protein
MKRERLRVRGAGEEEGKCKKTEAHVYRMPKPADELHDARVLAPGPLHRLKYA